MVYSISYFALKDHTFPVRVITRKVYPIARHPNRTFRRVESESEKKKVRLWKRKERMRKAPQEEAAPTPSPSIILPTAHPLSLLMYSKFKSGSGSPSFCTARPFRRNGVAVPAQRYHRSGATGWPFRRNGITVPAQRGGRSGATASPFRRDRMPVPARQDARSHSRHD